MNIYAVQSEGDPAALNANVFNAGSFLILVCDVQGHTDNLTFAWSIVENPETPGCTGCAIDTSETTSTLIVGQNALKSYHAGTYTCTVGESGKPDSRNGDNFTVVVVGK